MALNDPAEGFNPGQCCRNVKLAEENIAMRRRWFRLTSLQFDTMLGVVGHVSAKIVPAEHTVAYLQYGGVIMANPVIINYRWFVDSQAPTRALSDTRLKF